MLLPGAASTASDTRPPGSEKHLFPAEVQSATTDLRLSAYPGLDIVPGRAKDNEIIQGTPFDFSFSIGNSHDGSVATSPTLTVTTPAGVQILTATPATGGMCTLQTNQTTCTFDSLPAWDTYYIDFQAVSTTNGRIDIKGVVTSKSIDTNSSNNHYLLPLFVQNIESVVDLEVKLADAMVMQELAIDDSIAISVAVSNQHPENTATSVELQIPVINNLLVEFQHGCLESDTRHTTEEETVAHCDIGALQPNQTIQIDLLLTAQQSAE
ncbi:MAG: hypothetical protein AAF404_11255, partial [Pseudomonadota bacterium]